MCSIAQVDVRLFLESSNKIRLMQSLDTILKHNANMGQRCVDKPEAHRVAAFHHAIIMTLIVIDFDCTKPFLQAVLESRQCWKVGFCSCVLGFCVGRLLRRGMCLPRAAS